MLQAVLASACEGLEELQGSAGQTPRHLVSEESQPPEPNEEPSLVRLVRRVAESPRRHTCRVARAKARVQAPVGFKEGVGEGLRAWAQQKKQFEIMNKTSPI